MYTVGEISEILSGGEEYLHLREKEVARPFTLREMINIILTDNQYQKLRSLDMLSADGKTPGLTVGAALSTLMADPSLAEVLDQEFGKSMTLGQVLDELHAKDLAEFPADVRLNNPVTVGMIVDFLRNNDTLKNQGDRTVTLQTTLGKVFDLFGEDNVRRIVEEKTAEAAYEPAYAHTAENIYHYWLMIGLFIIVFSVASTVILELIDKDKR